MGDASMDVKGFFTKKKNILILAIFCTLLWGSAYPALKIGYELFAIDTADVFGKIAFAGYRFTISGLLVLLFHGAIYKKLPFPKGKELLQIVFLGLMLTSFFYVGLANTTGVNGAILNGTGTFFSVVLAHFFYQDDKLNAPKAVGTLIGFVGVVLISLTGQTRFHLQFNVLGDGLIILAAFVNSLGFIYSKKLSQGMNTVALTGYQLLFGGAFLVVAALMNGSPLQGFTPASTSLLMYLSFLTAAAFSIWTTLFKYNAVSSISLYKFLIPIFGALLSALILGESLFRWTNLTALILVSLGIYTVNCSK